MKIEHFPITNDVEEFDFFSFLEETGKSPYVAALRQAFQDFCLRLLAIKPFTDEEEKSLALEFSQAAWKVAGVMYLETSEAVSALTLVARTAQVSEFRRVALIALADLHNNVALYDDMIFCALAASLRDDSKAVRYVAAIKLGSFVSASPGYAEKALVVLEKFLESGDADNSLRVAVMDVSAEIKGKLRPKAALGQPVP